ncbi:hypothetical protein [Streptomyces sp. NPDC018352]|uniref:hypothetical protein n=1 Tax=Streptomyces sp. NPDC018352 TaxID=3157194 RepID=UPI0033DCCC6B
MITALDGLTVDLVPHTQSVAREAWTGKDSARPLSPQGLSQAGSLAAVMLGSIDAICSSPAKTVCADG